MFRPQGRGGCRLRPRGRSRRPDGSSDPSGDSACCGLPRCPGCPSDERGPGHQIECGVFQHRDRDGRHMASKRQFAEWGRSLAAVGGSPVDRYPADTGNRPGPAGPRFDCTGRRHRHRPCAMPAGHECCANRHFRFRSRAASQVKRRKESAGSGPGILPWPAPPDGGTSGRDGDGPSPSGRR